MITPTKYPVGYMGVGVSVVNALSSHLRLTIRRNGKVHEQTYQDGVPVEPLKEIGETDKKEQKSILFLHHAHSATSSFILSFSQRDFVNLHFKFWVRILLTDERTGKQEVFEYEGGLEAFVKYLNTNKTPINRVFHFNTQRDDGIG